MARSIINKIQRSTIYTLTIIAALSLSTFEALALPANRISQLAKEFTVLLDSESQGTGVILSKNDSKYTVLTAAHVVEYSDGNVADLLLMMI